MYTMSDFLVCCSENIGFLLALQYTIAKYNHRTTNCAVVPKTYTPSMRTNVEYIQIVTFMRELPDINDQVRKIDIVHIDAPYDAYAVVSQKYPGSQCAIECVTVDMATYKLDQIRILLDTSPNAHIVDEIRNIVNLCL